jgi:hypothetical protein
MNYEARLVSAAKVAGDARHALGLAEEERDRAIRDASQHGRLTAREIASHVGLSPQRVAQVIAAASAARPKLHDAMADVLRRGGGDWMPSHEIARTIWSENLYQRRDRHVLPPAQVRARAAQYPDLFETTSDGSGMIRLRQ